MGQGNSKSTSHTGLGLKKSGLPTDNELMRIIGCPNCLQTPFPPIFQCTTGHNVCKNCRTKLSECPLCQEVITDKRNYTVEALVQTSKYTCIYSSSGCDTVAIGDVMEGHIDTCQYKPQPCPFMEDQICTETSLEISEYRNHFQSVHNIKKSRSGKSLTASYKIEPETFMDCSNKASLWCWRSMLNFDGNTFLLAMFLDYRSQMIYWTISCLGVDKKADKYVAKLSLTTKTVRGLKLVWTLPVSSILKGIKHSQLDSDETNGVIQPSCTFAAFKKFITTSDNANDIVSHYVTTKFVISKFKS